WGALTDTKIGAFVDVAVTKGVACGLTSGGERKCFDVPGGKLREWSSLSNLVRIAAVDGHFCAMSRGGNLSCWDTTGSSALSPPAGLAAKFFTVGRGFACAADKERKLVCWGSTEGLELPGEAPAVKDLAAGDDFVCAIAAD